MVGKPKKGKSVRIKVSVAIEEHLLEAINCSVTGVSVSEFINRAIKLKLAQQKESTLETITIKFHFSTNEMKTFKKYFDVAHIRELLEVGGHECLIDALTTCDTLEEQIGTNANTKE
jgi:metal-responsive CopG/Arc/MetJ family transcriptional regulator